MQVLLGQIQKRYPKIMFEGYICGQLAMWTIGIMKCGAFAHPNDSDHADRNPAPEQDC